MLAFSLLSDKIDQGQIYLSIFERRNSVPIFLLFFSTQRDSVAHFGTGGGFPGIPHATLFGMSITGQQPPIGRLLKDGDVIIFGQHTLKVLQTPGHSHGSALLYCEEEKTAFTGNTLFRMSIRRTDFPESSWAEMEHSLSTVVRQLTKETIVLSGHGPQSTMADEMQYNLYLRSHHKGLRELSVLHHLWEYDVPSCR